VDVEKTIEFILDMQAQAVVNQAKRDAELDRIEKVAERTDRRLDRAIRLAVHEARNERALRQELDARRTASHRALEETVDRFIKSTGRGGNGSDGKDSE
jgi:hypothetical protein